MVEQASGLRMTLGRVSRPLRGVGLLAMPDGGLDISQHIESVCKVPPGTGVLQLVVPGIAVVGFNHHYSELDKVEVAC